MPNIRPTGKSNFAVQPIADSPVVPSIGSLPTQNEVRQEVPEVVTQGDSYFSRDSIGSAVFDSRMDFASNPSATRSLTRSRSSSGKSLSITPERPVAIASIDLLNSSYGNPRKTLEAVSQTLEVADFESRVMQEDYNYVMDSLENSDSTSSTYTSLKDSASSAFSDIENSVEAIQRLSAASEEFSRNLDIRFSWNTVQDKISEYYSSFTVRFGSDSAQSTLSSLGVDTRRDTSTRIVGKLQGLVNGNSAVDALSDFISAKNSVESKIADKDYVFDDGELGTYSNLEKLMKVAVCCEVLAKILNDTFTGTSGSVSVEMQKVYSGCNVFEPQNLRRGRKTESSHYSLINDVVSKLDSGKIEEFRSSFVESYTNSYDLALTKTGIGYPDEVCTPLDIYTRLFKGVADSFPSVYGAQSAGVLANPAEIYDSVILGYAMKQPQSSKEFNGFIRGVILTNMLDEDFLLGYDSGDEYDTVTQTKAEIDDSAEGSKTVVSKVATKNLQTNTLEEGSDIYNSVFQSSERVKNFPENSRSYTSKLLKKMDLAALTPDEIQEGWWFPLIFNFTAYTPAGYNNLFEDWWAGYSADPAVDGWKKNAPFCPGTEISMPQYAPQGYTDSINFRRGVQSLTEGLVDALQKFSRDDTGKTVANSILSTYDELITVFEEATGKKFIDVSPDGSFIVGSGTCTKRAVLDILIECYGNITSTFLQPGFITSTHPEPTNTLGAIANETNRLSTYVVED